MLLFGLLVILCWEFCWPLLGKPFLFIFVLAVVRPMWDVLDLLANLEELCVVWVIK